MARSFKGRAESTAAVGEIHAAFGRRDYWHDRLATGDAVTSLDSLVSHDDGTVAVRYTQHLGRQLLPATVARLVPGDVRMQYTETWRAEDHQGVQGTIGVTVSGGLGSCRATTWLRPSAGGAQLSIEGSVEVRIPLVGARLEKAIGADLATNIPSVLEFTTTWIADRG
ncbi:DUF2505 domain-containing protein [Mycolicibacterium sp. S2-37]|uniref:DUF2505 domain-containing protein n=1 Tax=Mycolicibacterium sp. S2-37 TaxID=2810297 RepID=UPI001A952075|nr:DUF2505 domain-containing protein [Mycolicibacterium sp. S2-37]MBO0675923.1 DUF2505 domain-containing protein [Mycolicibacterium sp. S2-37]